MCVRALGVVIVHWVTMRRIYDNYAYNMIISTVNRKLYSEKDICVFTVVSLLTHLHPQYVTVSIT